MVWKLTDKAAAAEPLPGVPWRDLDDAEFREVEKAYAERNQFDAHALRKSGFFEHEKAQGAGEES